MSAAPSRPSDDDLIERLRGGQLRDAELEAALRSADLKNRDLAGLDLSGLDLSGLDLSGCKLFKSDLSETNLAGADLAGAELSGADLRRASLGKVRAQGAGMGMADLTDAHAFGADLSDATLTGATLRKADLRCANLRGARLREADVEGATFTAADLRDAELSLCSVGGAVFNDADLRGARLRALSGFQSALWYGADIRNINFAGAYRLRRHIIDENYLKEFREAGPVQRAFYTVWWLSSDCGRSLVRWCGVILAIAVVFSMAFAASGVRLNHHEPGALTYFYYSIVTLTTLGYGDIVPSSSTGQFLVILEVCFGYLMLGGLISIFANKLARRGE
jgi:uncharacterized protein YjbI with pentapeptide repeats